MEKFYAFILTHTKVAKLERKQCSGYIQGASKYLKDNIIYNHTYQVVKNAPC